MDPTTKKSILVLFTSRWYSPQSAYHNQDLFRVIQCHIPRNAPIHNRGHGQWWTPSDSHTSTDPSTWRVYLCRTKGFGPNGWASGLLEIESGETFEDLELKYPDIATYDDLAIHVKIPVAISFNMVEIPSVGVRLPLHLSPFNTTMGANVIYARIAGGLRCGGLPAPSVKLTLRINSSNMSDGRLYALNNTRTPIGQVLDTLTGPATVDVIVEPISEVPLGPNGTKCAPPCATSLPGTSGEPGLVALTNTTTVPLGPSGKAVVKEQKAQDIAVRAKKYKTVDDAINATKLRLEVLEAIQAANKVKTDLDEKTAWIKGTARSDMQDLVEDYLA